MSNGQYMSMTRWSIAPMLVMVIFALVVVVVVVVASIHTFDIKLSPGAARPIR
jgi:uncharacterized membrane protein